MEKDIVAYYDISRYGDAIAKAVNLPEGFLSRANYYKNERARLPSLCAYSLLAHLLGKDLERLMDELRTNQYGKPDFESVHFSLSHSGEMVAVMVSSSLCGVDIQLVDELHDYDLVAKKVLSEELYGQYLTSEDKNAFFVRAWAEIEARTKMEGSGLSSLSLLATNLKGEGIPLMDSRGMRYYIAFERSKGEGEIEIREVRL